MGIGVIPHTRGKTLMIGPVSRVPRAPSASIRVHLRFIPVLAAGGGLPPISEALQIPGVFCLQELNVTV